MQAMTALYYYAPVCLTFNFLAALILEIPRITSGMFERVGVVTFVSNGAGTKFDIFFFLEDVRCWLPKCGILAKKQIRANYFYLPSSGWLTYKIYICIFFFSFILPQFSIRFGGQSHIHISSRTFRSREGYLDCMWRRAGIFVPHRSRPMVRVLHRDLSFGVVQATQSRHDRQHLAKYEHHEKPVCRRRSHGDSADHDHDLAPHLLEPGVYFGANRIGGHGKCKLRHGVPGRKEIHHE